MWNAEHLAKLKKGADAWNAWRREIPGLEPNFHEADLQGIDLRGANLRGANLCGAALRSATLCQADLRGAFLRGAILCKTKLREAKLTGAALHGVKLIGADLTEADLTEAALTGANLTEAILTRANLSGALLLNTDFKGANLTGCKVYGISAWNINLVGAQQSDLVITRFDEPVITVDNLDMAQFTYLLLHNDKIRQVIDTIGKKGVLILGRFTPGRKTVLDAIRDELRLHDYLPMMFDFQNPEGGVPVEGRNYIETVSTLAHMARFVIADITDAKVVLQELEHIVPSLPSVPVQPIIQSHTDITDVIIDFVGRLNFLEQLYVYRDLADVKANLRREIIQPAETRLTEIHAKRLQFLEQVRQITHG